MIEEKAHLYEIENKKIDLEIEEKRYGVHAVSIFTKKVLYFLRR